MHRAVKRHWLAFKQITEQSDTTLPSFVDRAFDKYLGCGDPTSGFARVRCGDCAKEQIVAFSCKARGLCTSCDAKRMAEAAAHLVDNVLPEAPYRQWVLTLPPSIRFRVARDHQLCGKLLNIGVRTVTAWYRQQARTIGMGDGLCAAISVSQRFGDGFRLNPHFHILFLDGVVLPRDDAAPEIQRLLPPSQADVEHVLKLFRRKTIRYLLRHGIVVGNADDELDVEGSALALCQKASILDRVTVGGNSGQLVARVMAEPPEPRPHGCRCAQLDGFSLHANSTVAPRDRAGLEHLCRYLCRPSFSVQRMDELPDGRIYLKFKRKWADGTIGKIYEPMDLVSKLVALVVKPRVNLLRYHGQFAANAKWRSQVCPGSARPRPSPAITAEQRRKRRTWAELLRRCFAIDALQCPCGGRREVIATIAPGPIATAILKHLGHETRPPRFAQPRPPPESQLDWVD